MLMKRKSRQTGIWWRAVTGLALCAWLAACGGLPGTTDVPAATGEPAEKTPVAGGKLVYGLTLAPSNIDPHVGASSELSIPLTSVYDTLVYQDLDGSFVAGLAERWDVSADGLVYTFYLRDDVTFHDGTPFNAESVKFSFDRITATDTHSLKAKGMMGPYSRTEVVDDYIVKVHFSEPYAPFLDSLSQVYLAPVSPPAVQQWGADYQLHQVGTGPFRFQKYVPNDHLTLVRNPDYDWAPDVYQHDGPAYLDEIEFRFYVDPAVRALALESGEAAVMGEMPPQDAARLEGDARFQLHKVPVPGQPLQVFLNTERAPTDDERVRRALLYATDRATIVETLFFGYSPVAYGPLTAATMGYEPSVAGSYAYDPARAGELLDEAGWTDSNGDGLRDKDGEPLVLRAYLQTWGYLPEVGQLLQSQYRQVGIDLQTQVVQYPAAVEAAAQNEHHLAPMVFFSSDPSVLDFTYLSANAEGGFNWSNVRDAELDRLLTEGVRTVDTQRRAELYGQAQTRIMDLDIVIPIRDYVNLNATSATVRGLRFDERAWAPWLYDVWVAE